MTHRWPLMMMVILALIASPVAFAQKDMAPEEVDHNVMPGLLPDAEDMPEAVPVSAAEAVAPIVEKPVEAVPTKAASDTSAVTDASVKPEKLSKIAESEDPEARDIPLIETQNDVYSSADVTYVTGGIGEDERKAIEAGKGDYNLHVMSARANGAFVGDVRVVISRKKDAVNEEILNLVAGPLLYVRLPTGSYTLEASLGAQKNRQNFSVATKGKPADIHVRWK